MASRQAEALAMVRRAERAGWRTEKITNGWRVQDNRGGHHIVHLTYSDRNALVAKLQDWEAAGLLEDEEKAKAEAAERKKNQLAEARTAAATKAKQLASQADLTQRAAGPYRTQIEDCDLDWITAEHPAPWMRWMYITPQAAATLLEKYNTGNRKMAKQAAERYKLIILSGQWHLTHQGIAIDTDQVLQDGQHRLAGVVAAGEQDETIQVPFAVFVGMPPENFRAIDEGRIRSASQMLTMRGEQSGAHLGTVIKMVAAYDSGNPREYVRQRMGNAAVFEALERDGDNYNVAREWGSRNFKKLATTPGPLGAGYYLIGRANGFDNPYFTAFFEGLAQNRKYGTDFVLPDDDPRHVLRNRFIATRPAPIEAVFWIIQSWNNMVTGRHPYSLRFTDASAPPQILICRPGEGTVPRGLVGEVGA